MVFSPSAPMLEHHEHDFPFEQAPIALPLAAVHPACAATAGFGDAGGDFVRLQLTLNKDKPTDRWGLRLMPQGLVEAVRTVIQPTQDVTEEYMQALHPIMQSFYNSVPVMLVEPGTPATKAGLRRLDVIVAINDVPTHQFGAYTDIANAIKTCDRHLVLDIMREDESDFLFREIKCPFLIPSYIKCYELSMSRTSNSVAWGFATYGFIVQDLGRDIEVTSENPELLEMVQMKGGLGINHVNDFTPAAESGLQCGDVIIEVNGRWCGPSLSTGLKRGGESRSLEVEMSASQITKHLKKADTKLKVIILRSIRPLPDPKPDSSIIDTVTSVASRVVEKVRRK